MSTAKKKQSQQTMNYPFEEVIDKTIVEKNKSEPRRRYLGGSMLGDKCARKIQYTYQGQHPDEDKEFNAQTLRIFQLGHELENSMAGWIRNAGFDLRTIDKNGEQFGFSIADDEIKGHIDGVICGGPP